MIEFRRTGWEVWDMVIYVEVLPQDDIKEHWAGDECWCNPSIEPVNDRKLIAHYAADGRD